MLLSPLGVYSLYMALGYVKTFSYEYIMYFEHIRVPYPCLSLGVLFFVTEKSSSLHIQHTF